MRRLTARVLWAGGLSGTAASVAFALGRGRMPGWFTSDPGVVAALLHGGVWSVWSVLAAAQPLNGLLFVFDGGLLQGRGLRLGWGWAALARSRLAGWRPRAPSAPGLAPHPMRLQG